MVSTQAGWPSATAEAAHCGHHIGCSDVRHICACRWAQRQQSSTGRLDSKGLARSWSITPDECRTSGGAAKAAQARESSPSAASWRQRSWEERSSSLVPACRLRRRPWPSSHSSSLSPASQRIAAAGMCQLLQSSVLSHVPSQPLMPKCGPASKPFAQDRSLARPGRRPRWQQVPVVLAFALRFVGFVCCLVCLLFLLLLLVFVLCPVFRHCDYHPGL